MAHWMEKARRPGVLVCMLCKRVVSPSRLNTQRQRLAEWGYSFEEAERLLPRCHKCITNIRRDMKRDLKAQQRLEAARVEGAMFRAIAIDLYGRDHWRRGLAQALKEKVDHIMAWENGVEIPRHVWHRLGDLCGQKGKKLDHLKGEIARLGLARP